MQNQDAKKSVAVSAVVFALGTLVSRVLGLVRDMMTARYFPAEVRDAFVVAFRLPNVFRRILGEGSLSVSFIPVFVETLRGKEAKDETQRLVNGVFSILMSASITFSLIAIIYMDEFLGLFLQGKGYMEIPGKFEMTVRLARIMFGFLVLMSLYAFFMAVLNSMKKFAASAMAPALLNVCLIAAALISGNIAAPELALAWAVIVGGFLQMAVLIPPILKSGYLPKFTLDWKSPHVKQVLKTLVPSLFGMSIAQLTALANVHFASYLPQGTHTYIYLADRIIELPLSLIVVSVGTAMLPTLSAYWADGNRAAMIDTTSHYLRLILFVSLPASVGMYMMAQPISEVLFMGQKFTPEDAAQTALVIQIYALTLLVVGAVRIVAQGFYAIKNTMYPAASAAVSLVGHLGIAYFLTNNFGLPGLSFASVVSGGLNLMILVYGYRRHIGSLGLTKLAKGLVRVLAANATMAAVLLLHEPLLDLAGRSVAAKTFSLLVIIGMAIVTYFAAAHVLRIPEYRETAETFLIRIRSRLSRLRRSA